ncbi:uncharacterized protein MONBRDRAFT_8258 [Monosiga brevicollis MX1]|uniref:Uncharacterized protein n=1 Tax=Monosiga brevicollis TaxID=81824 RepID=A9UZI3_MONBE|nr:uncharacterized protein MONBRDRAFT_8258 [Monosiga brevicollis MX1]EDQ89235.1 predicted protein [Monosiga brevicollis MX1]|eukprot:XP_001745811.1 hypothetical protein [Monosiga brevicollis MX1]
MAPSLELAVLLCSTWLALGAAQSAATCRGGNLSNSACQDCRFIPANWPCTNSEWGDGLCTDACAPELDIDCYQLVEPTLECANSDSANALRQVDTASQVLFWFFISVFIFVYGDEQRAQCWLFPMCLCSALPRYADVGPPPDDLTAREAVEQGTELHHVETRGEADKMLEPAPSYENVMKPGSHLRIDLSSLQGTGAPPPTPATIGLPSPMRPGVLPTELRSPHSPRNPPPLLLQSSYYPDLGVIAEATNPDHETSQASRHDSNRAMSPGRATVGPVGEGEVVPELSAPASEPNPPAPQHLSANSLHRSVDVIDVDEVQRNVSPFSSRRSSASHITGVDAGSRRPSESVFVYDAELQ